MSTPSKAELLHRRSEQPTLRSPEQTLIEAEAVT